MSVNTIDASLLRKCFLAGAKNLEIKKEWINELNVFPVPDGDTGTNMTLTIMSAANEVSALPEADIDQIAKAISSGSLRGARGNSGVILSQFFAGMTKGFSKFKKAPSGGFDYIIVDTAGRLQIDEELMNELVNISEIVNPDEVLLVLDSMMGQDAINVINGFNEKLNLTGVILTRKPCSLRTSLALLASLTISLKIP